VPSKQLAFFGLWRERGGTLALAAIEFSFAPLVLAGVARESYGLLRVGRTVLAGIGLSVALELRMVTVISRMRGCSRGLATRAFAHRE
jgi:hypothetical protein